MTPSTTPAPYTQKIQDLVASSFPRRYDDLGAMLEDARAAIALVEEPPEELPAVLVVKAWTQLGNAFRLTGSYAEAEKALARAEAIPISDLPTSIHLVEVQASLLRNTGRYECAACLLGCAIAAQEPLENADGKARLYIQLGIVELDTGNRARAVRCFRTALDLLTPDSPPDLLIAAGHNMFQTLIAAGRLAAASTALANLEPAYRRLTSPRIMARAEWMRARLYRAKDQLPAARIAYERAHELLSAETLTPDLAQLTKEMSDICPPLPAVGCAMGEGGQGGEVLPLSRVGVSAVGKGARGEGSPSNVKPPRGASPQQRPRRQEPA
jgi:tetratricopeptide (TPR) repeat protein